MYDEARLGEVGGARQLGKGPSTALNLGVFGGGGENAWSEARQVMRTGPPHLDESWGRSRQGFKTIC